MYSTQNAYKKGVTKLKEKLLKLGGKHVVMSSYEEDLLKLLKRGKPLKGRVKMMLGNPNECHRNSALCWDANRDQSQIATGYALSQDGYWRQHSWVMAGSKIVETTQKRVLYFGFKLTPQEAEVFLASNE